MSLQKAGQPKRQHSKPSLDKGPLKPGLETRLTAQRLLGAVLDTATSLDGLTDDSHGHPQYLKLDARDRSLVRAILSSALRHHRTIETFIGRLVDKPLPDSAKSLRQLLHVAAAQILFLDIPDHSAVDLAVDAARADPRNNRFVALVNALLRRMSREKATVLPMLLSTVTDAPDWLINALEVQYGREKAHNILAMHRQEAPVDFTAKTEAPGWAEKLGGMLLPVGTIRVSNLQAAIPEMPGFAEGAWWVQDIAASLPVKLMGELEGKRVADLCAAPGGKTAQIAAAGAKVTALDVSASRLKRLSANFDRLGLKAETVAASLFDWQADAVFDAVLLDAPCSSTGTIRRHPDVAWTKSPQDISKLADLQFRMIARAMTLVRPGGILLFSNCSLLKEEGEDLYARVQREIPELKPDPIGLSELPGLEFLISQDGCLRSTPADLVFDETANSGMDGFFAARFIRTN